MTTYLYTHCPGPGDAISLEERGDGYPPCDCGDWERCAAYEPCPHGHDRDDGEPCRVWMRCRACEVVEVCHLCASDGTCPDCGGSMTMETAP